MNKIIELMINFEEFEFEDLGVEIISLVDQPAIGVNWLAFAADASFRENPDCEDGFEHEMPDGTWMCGKEHTLSKEEEEKWQSAILKLAEELGEEYNPDEVIEIDAAKSNFATIGEYESALNLNLGNNVDRNTEVDLKFRYKGGTIPNSRRFCQRLVGFNRLYTETDIARFDGAQPGMGPGGTNSYSVFQYKGGVRCRHYWEAVATFINDSGTRVIFSLGPVTDTIGRVAGFEGGDNAGQIASPRNNYWRFSDDDKQIVIGPAMIPRDLINRKDELGNNFHVYFSEDTIQKIAAKFLSDNNTHNTDVNHNNIVSDENTLLESWIVEDPKQDKSTALGFNVPKGTWMTSFKINNKDTWQKIKSGELNGFSVEGQFLEKLVKV